MLDLRQKHESLAAKLLLSSALVAVSLAYGWWQRDNEARPAIVMAPLPVASTPTRPLPAPNQPMKTASAPAMPLAPVQPDTAATQDSAAASNQASAPKSEIIKMPRTDVTGATPAPPQGVLLPASPVPPSPPPPTLSAQASLAMYAPTDDVSPPLALVTGAPPAGIVPAIPAGAGTHLLDGDYLSDKHQFEWGDLVVKVSIHGGQITAVQILKYPDHRSQSLYLSQMAGPALESELIKSQQAQVDVVSSATDTSYAFQDAISSVIIKAARG